MDPCLSHEIVTQLLDIYTPPVRRIRTRPRGRPYDAGKRYATYFPSKASFDAEWNVADDESTWEFFAPVSHKTRNFSTDSCSSASTTAAQEIASRYRAGMPLKAVLSELGSTSVSSEESNGTSWETALSDTSITFDPEAPPPIPEKDHLVTAQCKSFRDPELSDSLQEALDTMRQDGRNESDQLVCHRAGCHDVVRNIEAFMYHLHIHNIHDETLRCSFCDKQFSHGFQLSLHRCCSEETWLHSPLSGPLKECFLHVFSRMTSCFN